MCFKVVATLKSIYIHVLHSRKQQFIPTKVPKINSNTSFQMWVRVRLRVRLEPDEVREQVAAATGEQREEEGERQDDPVGEQQGKGSAG